MSPATKGHGSDPSPSPFPCVQTPHPEQLGPHVGSSETLDLISSKDLASHLTDYDWNLFKSIHQVRGKRPDRDLEGETSPETPPPFGHPLGHPQAPRRPRRWR